MGVMLTPLKVSNYGNYAYLRMDYRGINAYLLPKYKSPIVPPRLEYEEHILSSYSIYSPVGFQYDLFLHFPLLHLPVLQFLLYRISTSPFSVAPLQVGCVHLLYTENLEDGAAKVKSAKDRETIKL